MGVSKKIYKIGLKFREIQERRSVKFSFITFLTFIFFFFTFGAYAGDEQDLTEETKISPAWEGTKCFHNEISGTVCEEDNMNSREGLEILNSSWTALSLIAPEITEEGKDLGSNPNIPYDLKRGLLGMTEDASNALYANYPMINIPNHLAQQWVPGYKDGSTSLYAANGYEELSGTGIIGLWTRVLNISYVIFVIIMIIAGFMIMFRHKLGGQTIVTLGSVLPRVIVALIIATFSFAIAGLIIDLGGVASGIVAYVLGLDDGLSPISTLGGLMGAVFKGGLGITATISGVIGLAGVASFVTVGASAASGVTGLAAIVAAVSNPVGWVITGIVGSIGVILALVIVGIILVGAIRVLITLFKAYFSLLISVILGPLQITLGAIPGNNRMITNWLLSILRNVLVFPVVLFIINLPNALLAQGDELKMSLPDKLVGNDKGMTLNATGWFFIAMLKIFVLYFAAQAPKFLETWLPANSSPAVKEGMQNVKASMQKIPLVGGLFKG